MSSVAIPPTAPFTFTRFSKLPPELRNQIWNDALLTKDRPALFPYQDGCWHPIYLSESDEGYIANTDNIRLEFNSDLLEPIPIEIPVCLVNREARDAAIAWAHRQGARIISLGDMQRHVFGRLFDNEQDTLYVGLSNFADFFVEPYNRLAEPDLFGRIVGSGPSLRFIAVPEALLERMPGALEEMFEWFRGLEVIFIIVNAHHGIAAQQRWELESAQGKALLYDQSQRRFDWEDHLSATSSRWSRPRDKIKIDRIAGSSDLTREDRDRPALSFRLHRSWTLHQRSF
ncbi:hypothetical protein VE02_03468 [Pseudogymnoascus sp. 03VT05]|nr:hypothetical protein VE02_03468 [Pseudogymnoascus sp. 03VT05]